MAKRSHTAAFDVSTYSGLLAYKLIVRVDLGVYKNYLPAFSYDSMEFEQLEEFYGNVFMMHVLPEKYGYQNNIISYKGCIQVRYTDFSPFGVTKSMMKAALGYWKDFNYTLKRRKHVSSIDAFKELSDFQNCLLAVPVPGLESKISTALDRLRPHQSVLVLIEPNGPLFYRTTEEIVSAKQVLYDFYIGSKYYYIRPGASAFLKKVQKHPRCVLRLYSSMSENTCARVLPALGGEEYFSAKFCGKDVVESRQKLMSRIWTTNFAISGGFNHHNTLLIESDYTRCKSVKKGLVLVPSYDLHQLQHCPSKLPLQHVSHYILDILTHANYDVGEYIEAHPFTSYS